MKILQVCSAETVGGGERHIIDLTRALAERGHEVHLAVRRKAGLRRELNDIVTAWHVLPLLNQADLYSAWRLRRIIRKSGISVVHCHLARDYPVAGLACTRTDAKLILTRHHFNRFNSNPVYRWAIGNAGCLIAVSASVARELERAFPKLANRIRIVPNWLHAGKSTGKEEARRQLGISRIAIGVIGELSPVKGQDLLLTAMRHLEKDLLERIELLIIGEPKEGHERYLARLRDMAGDLECPVRFEGHIPDMAGLLAGIDIVAVPSRNEGFSLVAIEAMSAGCAVVAMRKGGMEELIEPGRTGLLAESDDAQSLAGQIAILIKDAGLRKQLGAAASATAAARYSRDRIVSEIIDIYGNQPQTQKNPIAPIDKEQL